MGRTIAALIELHTTPPAHIKTDRQWASIQRKLKMQLLFVLKHEASADFHEILIPVLEALQVPSSEISE